uniref:Uncharacterized protein n=1 Tax=Kalanchoe fedtschenkoi TaxID=63787 RepID=A0A7N0VCP9_KALFE
MSDSTSQKKRMEDALERRFAAAKAELQQQQNRSSKRPRREDRTPSSGLNGGIQKSLPDKIVKPPAYKSHKKDEEETSPAYAGLAHSVDQNLLRSSIKMSDGKRSVVDSLMHELLQKGDFAQKYLQGSRSVKIDHSILLDNYVPPRGLSSIVRSKDSQSESKRSLKHMSMKQLKKAGALELPKEMRRYEAFLPMHEMWKDFMKQLLRPIGNAQLAQYIFDADLHGAIMIVADCKMAVYNGVTGIMIRETGETFGIITADDKFRVVPKKLSVFILQVEGWKVTLHGDKLINRKLNP